VVDVMDVVVGALMLQMLFFFSFFLNVKQLNQKKLLSVVVVVVVVVGLRGVSKSSNHIVWGCGFAKTMWNA